MSSTLTFIASIKKYGDHYGDNEEKEARKSAQNCDIRITLKMRIKKRSTSLW